LQEGRTDRSANTSCRTVTFLKDDTGSIPKDETIWTESKELETVSSGEFPNMINSESNLEGYSGRLEDAALETDQYTYRPGSKGKIWRVSEELWLEFRKGNKDDKSSSPDISIPNPHATYLPNLIVPQHSKANRSVCGIPVLDPRSPIVTVWSYIIMWVDLIYTAFLVPISVAFLAGDTTSPLAWIDFVAGLVFIASLGIGFHTGFIAQNNLQQAVVTNGRHVAKYYMTRGTFVIDLVSSLVYIIQMVSLLVRVLEPGQLLWNETYIDWFTNALQILRMVRLLAFFGMAQDLLIAASTTGFRALHWLPRSATYVTVIIFILFWVVNFAGCLWFCVGWWYSVNNRSNWIASKVGNPEGCGTVSFAWQELPEPLPPGCEDLEPLLFSYAYALSIYWSVTTMTTVGYGDISPTNVGEIFVAMVVMLLGIMSFAFLIGSVQEVFENATESAQKASMLREKLSEVDSWIGRHTLAPKIRSQIRRYFMEAWVHREDLDEETRVFLELPTQLQALVASHLTRSTLREVRILGDLQDDARELLGSKLVPLQVGIGQDICTQGEYADKLWVMQKGVMAAIYGGRTFEVEKAPCLIAETTVLQEVDRQFEYRPCGYRATTTCHLSAPPALSRLLRCQCALCPRVDHHRLRTPRLVPGRGFASRGTRKGTPHIPCNQRLPLFPASSWACPRVPFGGFRSWVAAQVVQQGKGRLR